MSLIKVKSLDEIGNLSQRMTAKLEDLLSKILGAFICGYSPKPYVK